MIDNWKEDIRYSSKLNLEELNRWCTVYGEERYKEYYSLVKFIYPTKKVPLGILRECIIYDMPFIKRAFFYPENCRIWI